MTEKIQNTLTVDIIGGSLRNCTGIVFYLRQGCFFRKYVPQVLPDTDGKKLLVIIPFSDAAQLRDHETAEVQIAYLDENGTPRSSDVAAYQVKQLLDEEGYHGNQT